jgi:hypothetical protein
MTRRPTVARRAPMVLGLAFIAIVASALGWHFYQAGRGPALVEPSVEIERTNRETVPQYSLLEADLRVEADFENPFDPEEVNVTAVFTSPSGRVIDIPAFYFRDFNRTLAGDEERLSASGDPGSIDHGGTSSTRYRSKP